MDEEYEIDWPLAAADGEWEIVQEALEACNDFSATDSRGWTAGHFAAGDGAIEMLKWLHERGADLRATDKDNRTPLHRAMRPGKGKRPSREAAAFLLDTVYTPVERFVYGEAVEQDIDAFSSQMASVSEDELRRTFPELGGSTIAHLLAERGRGKQSSLFSSGC